MTIPNNSLVDIDDLLYRTGFDPDPTNANGLHNQTLVCVTDLVDCCDSPRTVRGDWYYSNGNVVTYTSQIYGKRFVKNRGPNEIINGRQFIVSSTDGAIRQEKGVSAVSSPVQVIPVLIRPSMLMLVSYN